MTTVQKVSEYLNAIGVEHSDVQIVKENEATSKISNVEAFIKAIESAGFSQYNYNDSIISSKEDLGYIAIDDTYRQENHYRHNELNAYIMVVEYPYRSKDNYIHLSNESLAPKNWLTTYVDKLNLPTKEEVLSNVLEKVDEVKKLKGEFQKKFEELKEKAKKATK